MVALFQSRNAVRVVGPAELPLVWMELIANPEERRALGARAAKTAQSQTGATQRTVEALVHLLKAEKSAPDVELQNFANEGTRLQ
jgi:hypothetical protein